MDKFWLTHTNVNRMNLVITRLLKETLDDRWLYRCDYRTNVAEEHVEVKRGIFLVVCPYPVNKDIPVEYAVVYLKCHHNLQIYIMLLLSPNFFKASA